MDLILTVDGAPEDMRTEVGLVTKYIPDLAFTDPGTAKAIAVGPPAMMRFSREGAFGAEESGGKYLGLPTSGRCAAASEMRPLPYR